MAEGVVRWQGTEELDCWNRGVTPSAARSGGGTDSFRQKTLPELRMDNSAFPKLRKREEVSKLNEELQHAGKENGSSQETPARGKARTRPGMLSGPRASASPSPDPHFPPGGVSVLLLCRTAPLLHSYSQGVPAASTLGTTIPTSSTTISLAVLELLYVPNHTSYGPFNRESKDKTSVSTLGLSHRLVIDGRIHAGCCGAYKARLRWAPLTLELGWVWCNNTLGHQHMWEGGTGR